MRADGFSRRRKTFLALIPEGAMKDKSTLNFFKVIFIMLVASWLTIFATGAGFLVWSEEISEGLEIPLLKCTYFTGLNLIKREHVMLEHNFIGDMICPRVIVL